MSFELADVLQKLNLKVPLEALSALGAHKTMTDRTNIAKYMRELNETHHNALTDLVYKNDYILFNDFFKYNHII